MSRAQGCAGATNSKRPIGMVPLMRFSSRWILLHGWPAALIPKPRVNLTRHHGGYGGGSVNPGPKFATPRGHGEEASQDEDKEHERKFNEAAPGAWSKGPEPGKDKPSPNK